MLEEDRPVVAGAVLGVVPSGSGCDFARSFGLPADPAGASACLAGSGTRAIDLGKVTFLGPDGSAVVRYFANVAQVYIDQFLASAEAKWRRMSGITLLLRHGYEGQGPEHSSARLERFLELCADGNLQVCNLTTPAQLFHALRRQMHRNFRKPLVIMSPKSLLRHKLAVSAVREFTSDAFRTVIDDHAIPDPHAVRTVLLASGRFCYALL